MKSGRLTETITIERFTSDVNEYGTPVSHWTRLCTLRAEKVEQSTSEYIRNFGASDEELVIFRARFFEGITNADRVIWNGDVFNIEQHVPIGRRTGIELRCTRMPGGDDEGD